MSRRRSDRQPPFSNRQRALRAAKALVKQARQEHPDAFAMFMYQCPKCKTICTFKNQNEAPKSGRCFHCGHIAKVEKLAFKIYYKLEHEDHGLVHEARQSLQAGDSGGEDRSGAGGTAPVGSVGSGDDAVGTDDRQGGIQPTSGSGDT